MKTKKDVPLNKKSTILTTIFDNVETLQSFINRVQIQHPHSQPQRKEEAIKRQKINNDNNKDDNNTANEVVNDDVIIDSNSFQIPKNNDKKRKSIETIEIEDENQKNNENNNNNNFANIDNNIDDDDDDDDDEKRNQKQKKDYFRPIKKQKEKHEKQMTYTEFLNTTLICNFKNDPALPLNIPIEHTQSQRDVVARVISTLVPQFWKNPITRDHVLAKGFQKTVKQKIVS